MKATRTNQRGQQRLERALRTLSGCNRALLRAKQEAALLQEICRVVVEDGGYGLARIGRVEDAGKLGFTPLAHAGRGIDDAEVRTLWSRDAERDRSATGMAIRTGAECLINDVQAESYPALWRDFARRHGIGSVLGLPLYIDGTLFGALTIGAPEADAFGVEERQV